MGAEVFVAYYGLQFPIDEEELELFEEEAHDHQVAARKHGLNHYWGNFSAEDEYISFIGAELGLIGYENEAALEIGDAELAQTIAKTKQKLAQAGFKETPKLLLYHEPDL